MGNKQPKDQKTSRKTLPYQELEMLKKSTNFTETQILQWHEGFLAECENGKLSKDQFLQYIKELYSAAWFEKISKGDPDKFRDNIFRVFDTDNSGYIEFKEFLLAVDLTSNGQAEDKIRFAFKIYDIDNKGKIPKDEMMNVIQAMFETFGCSKKEAQVAAKAIYDKLDADGDSCITLQEFVKCCKEDPNLFELLAA